MNTFSIFMIYRAGLYTINQNPQCHLKIVFRSSWCVSFLQFYKNFQPVFGENGQNGKTEMGFKRNDRVALRWMKAHRSPNHHLFCEDLGNFALTFFKWQLLYLVKSIFFQALWTQRRISLLDDIQGSKHVF